MLRTLLRRGLVRTHGPIFSFAHGVALQPAGLALAYRLGGINSEIVDVDQLISGHWAENWNWAEESRWP